MSEKKIDSLEIAEMGEYIMEDVSIKDMLEGQKKVDEIALGNAGTDYATTKRERAIALYVETGEMMNEIGRLWKYWKKNHKSDMERVLDELADVLHFILSPGVEMGVDPVHTYIVKYPDPVDQILELMGDIVRCGKSVHGFNRTMAAFRGLLSHLGITWGEMVIAYWKKNAENIRRQASNY